MQKISSEFNRLDVAKRLKPQVILFVRYYCIMPPQLTRAPAAPLGCDVKSSVPW